MAENETKNGDPSLNPPLNHTSPIITDHRRDFHRISRYTKHWCEVTLGNCALQILIYVDDLSYAPKRVLEEGHDLNIQPTIGRRMGLCPIK